MFKVALLSNASGKGMLSVMDNGRGLPEEGLESHGTGLRNMACRMALIGGSFDIQRGPTGGTLVTCVFPARHASMV